MNLTNSSRTDESDENLTFICKSSPPLSSSSSSDNDDDDDDYDNQIEKLKNKNNWRSDDMQMPSSRRAAAPTASTVVASIENNDSDCEYYDAVSKLSIENHEDDEEVEIKKLGHEMHDLLLSSDLKKLSDEDELRMIELSRCQIEKFKFREIIDNGIESNQTTISQSEKKNTTSLDDGVIDRNEQLRNELIELRMRNEREEEEEEREEAAAVGVSIGTSQHESGETKSQQSDMVANSKHFNYTTGSGATTTTVVSNRPSLTSSSVLLLQAPMVVIDEMNTSNNDDNNNNIPEEEDLSVELDKFKTWALNSSLSGSKPNVVVVDDDDEEEELLDEDADIQITRSADENTHSEDVVNEPPFSSMTNESLSNIIIDEDVEQELINPVDKFIHFSSLKKQRTSDTQQQTKLSSSHHHHHSIFNHHHFHHRHSKQHRLDRKINKTAEDDDDSNEDSNNHNANNEEMNVDEWAEGYHENANFGDNDTSEDCLDDSDEDEEEEFQDDNDQENRRDRDDHHHHHHHHREKQRKEESEKTEPVEMIENRGGGGSSSNVRFIDENNSTAGGAVGGGGSGSGTNLSGPTHSSSLSSKTSLGRTATEGGARTSFRLKTKETLMGVLNKFEKAVKHMQNKADEKLHHDKETHPNNNSDSDSEDANINESTKAVKYKAARSNKATHEFEKTHILQILNSNYNHQQLAQNSSNSSTNPNSAAAAAVAPSPHSANNNNKTSSSDSVIWSMKFSPCGKLLATAGKGQKILVWVLKSYHSYFLDQFQKHNSSSVEPQTKSVLCSSQQGSGDDQSSVFSSRPFLTLHGHSSDIIDLSWSGQLFLLSASSDKTCRLWHVYKSDCLCIFHHNSIISAVSFHPKDDRYFLTACLDGKLRLWNMAEKKVLYWNDLANLNETAKNFITAICFCQGGKTIAVGTFSGKCVLYNTEHLKYYSLINVRSTRGRNSKGSKITGIEVLNNDENKILITSNDSRIRIYDLRDSSLHCKYKGFANSTVHIKASLSADDRFILCGSKNKCTYFWKTNYQYSMLSTGRRDRNNSWERIQVHNAVVTSALFSPKPQLILNQLNNACSSSVSLAGSDTPQKKSGISRSGKSSSNDDHVYVMASAAGCDGLIKICINKSSFVS